MLRRRNVPLGLTWFSRLWVTLPLGLFSLEEKENQVKEK